MSDEILTSIASERSSYTAGNALAKSSAPFNSLLPSAPKGESFPSTYEVTTTDETSQAKADSQFVHRMPSSHFIADSFLVIDMAAPSAGTTSERVGLNIIKELRVRNGSVVQEFQSYAAVMQYVLSKSTPSQRQQILNAVGGASATAETVIVPLPVFWTPVGQGGIQKNNVALPAFLTNAPVELEITLNPASALLAAGGSFAADPYSSVRVVHIQRRSNASVYQSVRSAGDWSFWTYDYQTTSTRTTLPDATETRVDLSQFDGSSAGIFFAPVASTSVTANDNYVVASGVNQIRTELNGSEFLRLEANISPSTSERVIDYLAYTFGVSNGTDGGDPTFSHRAKLVPFGGSLAAGNNDDGQDNQIHFESYYNTRDATRIDQYVSNGSGAEMQTFFTNIRYARMYIKDGQLNRQK